MMTFLKISLTVAMQCPGHLKKHKGSRTQKECQQWTPISPSVSAKMASVMMELTEEARAHMFGPWNPYFHVTKVLIDTMDRVSITGLD